MTEPVDSATPDDASNFLDEKQGEMIAFQMEMMGKQMENTATSTLTTVGIESINAWTGKAEKVQMPQG